MDTLGLLAVAAILSSILAKIVFAFRIRNLDQVLEKEQNAYQAVKKELLAAQQRHKLMEAEKKRLDVRRGAIQRNLRKMKSTLNELQNRQQEEDAVRAHQQAMLKESRKS